MATLIKHTTIAAPADDVWDALADFGALHDRLVPGFVVDTRVDGDARVVTFFNGTQARELFVGRDEEHRRLSYAVVESGLGFTHHMASAQVIDEGDERCRFVWITDVLP